MPKKMNDFDFYDAYMELMDVKSAVAQERPSILEPYLVQFLTRPKARVLDLCCGAGLYSFLFDRLKMDVVGVDFQKKMLSRARAYDSGRDCDAQFVLADARKMNFKDESFDYAVQLGNTVPCFKIHEFENLAREVLRVLKREGTFIIEYMDLVYTFVEEYKRVLYEGTKKGEIISFHGYYNPDEGTLTKIYLNLGTKKSFNFEYAIWAPWLLRFVLTQAGFSLKQSLHGLFGYARLYPRRTAGIIDVFEKQPNGADSGKSRKR